MRVLTFAAAGLISLGSSGCITQAMWKASTSDVATPAYRTAANPEKNKLLIYEDRHLPTDVQRGRVCRAVLLTPVTITADAASPAIVLGGFIWWAFIQGDRPDPVFCDWFRN